MKKNQFMIFIVLLFVASCAKEIEYTEINSLPNKEISIETAHQGCDIDKDCSSVRTKCTGCECYGVPINKQFEVQYKKEYEELCRGYSGSSCDVMCALGSIKCINSTCTFVEEDLPENEIDSCTMDEECIIVQYSHCCGATKRAINQAYLKNYNDHPEWQVFDNPEICSTIGVCADDSDVTKAECKDSRCILVY